MKNKKQNTAKNFSGAKNVRQSIQAGRKSAAAGKSMVDIFKQYQSLIIFLFAFLLYSNTLNHSFVLDDGLMIKDNRFTLKGIRGIPEIFTHDQLGGLEGSEASAIYQGGRYRPLSQVLFAIEMQFFKLKPFYWHFIHVLLYSLLCVLIFKTLRKLFVSAKADKWYLSLPFLAAVLYAAHPIHTEVAANVKSADEVMCMMGSMLSLYFSICYIDRGKITDLVLSFVFFLFGIFSKENAITFIAVVPLTVFIFRKVEFKKYVVVILPLLAAAVIYFIVRYITVGFSAETVEVENLFHNPFMFATTGERYATIMLTWLKYIVLLVFSHPLTHDYYPKQIPIIGWNDFRAIFSLVLYFALVVFAFITIKRRNIFAYGILFFLITFSVTSNIVFNLGLFMNERLMFIPSLGFVIILALLLIKGYEYLKRNNAQHWITILIIAVLFFYAVKTISRNTVWKSDFTLFATDVETSENSGRCNVIAGSLIVKEARTEKDSTVKYTQFEKAAEYLKRGLEIYDGNIEGWNSLGEVSIYLSRNSEAEDALKMVLSIDSINATALNNLFYLGKQYQDQMLDNKALGVYNYLNSKVPSAKYYYNIAMIYKGLGKTDTAIAILDRAISVQPDFYDAYNLAAEYYGQLKNDYTKALSYLERAYNLNSEYCPTLENLGVLYGIKADYEMSLSYFEKALAVDSTDASVYTNMARTYQVMGNSKKAQEYMIKASKFAGNK